MAINLDRELLLSLARQAADSAARGEDLPPSDPLVKDLDALDTFDRIRVIWFVRGAAHAHHNAQDQLRDANGRADRERRLRHCAMKQRQEAVMNCRALAVCCAVLGLLLFISVQIGNERTATNAEMSRLEDLR